MSNHKEIWGEGTDDYASFGPKLAEVTEKYLTSSSRFQKITAREDKSDLSIEAIKGQARGKHFIRHRGIPAIKSADDMIIFQQLLWDQRPATVIELGTFLGGSAVWLADMLRLMEIPSHVYSMDIDPSLILDRAKEIKPENLTFLQGDSNHIEKTFTNQFLQDLPRPWLVIEDAHTNVYGVLKYFHDYMQAGDYFIIEDQNPDLPLHFGYDRIFPCTYKRAGDVKLKVLKSFLTEYSQYYSVDSFYTDFFGYNGTWNWHGYIRRMEQ